MASKSSVPLSPPKEKDASPVPIVVRAVEMCDELRDLAIKVCQDVMSSAPPNKLTNGNIARMIRVKMDKRTVGSPWQCFVGTSFGASVTHETDGYIFLALGDKSVLIYKGI